MRSFQLIILSLLMGFLAACAGSSVSPEGDRSPANREEAKVRRVGPDRR